MDFPCAIYQSSGYEEPFYVSPHWHNNMEILYFKNGEYYVNVDMEPQQVAEEMFVFINPQELHRLTKEKGPYDESAVVFDLELLKGEDLVYQELLSPIMTRKKEISRYVPALSSAGQLIKQEYEQILNTFAKEKMPTVGGILRVKAALYNILGILGEGNLIYDREVAGDYRVEYIKDILNYIKGHYNEKIRIGDMADRIGMNEQYFCRFFKKMLGVTPVEYLNEYRIARVKQALVSGNESIMNIAMDCGFTHMGNFIKMFKKTEGCTPSDYRKQNKKSK